MKYLKIADGSWRTELLELANNGEGIRLYLFVRFDGYGNSLVHYEVAVLSKKTTYEKHNAAAEAYRMACDKQSAPRAGR